MSIGLVLAGGGGRGAFEIGVWQALHERGLDARFTHVSGTSVGALSAALFAQGDIEIAKKTWSNISNFMILSPNIMGDASLYFDAGKKPQGLDAYMHRRQNDGGLFSREGLAHIINSVIDFNRIAHSRVKCYATCYEIGSARARAFSLNGMKRESIISVLLASSAIPGIFPKETVEGLDYYDGGLADNVPVMPLFLDNADKALVVHLSPQGHVPQGSCPGMRLYEICPPPFMESNIRSTLDFDPRSAADRMEIGYKSAMEEMNAMENFLG